MDDTCANPSWTVLIVYKCVSRALWASCVYTFAALSGSVFSEAFLVGMDDGVPTVMDLRCIKWKCFVDLIAPDCHVVAALMRALFEIFVQPSLLLIVKCSSIRLTTHRSKVTMLPVLPRSIDLCWDRLCNGCYQIANMLLNSAAMRLADYKAAATTVILLLRHKLG
eukprot:scaffold11891_cov165-Skeletonema_dohrnii-CCMP3373.AAC.1